MASSSIAPCSSRSFCPIRYAFVTSLTPTFYYPRQITSRRKFDFLAMGKQSKSRVKSAQKFSTSKKRGFMEYPDGDSDSEDEDEDTDSDSEDEDEDDTEEENDLDYESDWETEKDSLPNTENADKLARRKYEEDLVKEVEQLLEPEQRAILQQNESPNLDKISTAKWNPLHTLALAVQIHFMDDLLDNGVDIDIVDKNGMTALHKAIIGKIEAVISHLLRKGANPNLIDKDGATPLHYAVQVGAIQTMKLLMKYKVDINIADNEGWTPLHVAVQGRNRDIVKILLVNGADKTRRTKDGRTAMDISFCHGKDFKSYDLAKLLEICHLIDTYQPNYLFIGAV